MIFPMGVMFKRFFNPDVFQISLPKQTHVYVIYIWYTISIPTKWKEQRTMVRENKYIYNYIYIHVSPWIITETYVLCISTCDFQDPLGHGHLLRHLIGGWAAAAYLEGARLKRRTWRSHRNMRKWMNIWGIYGINGPPWKITCLWVGWSGFKSSVGTLGFWSSRKMGIWASSFRGTSKIQGDLNLQR